MRQQSLNCFLQIPIIFSIAGKYVEHLDSLIQHECYNLAQNLWSFLSMITGVNANWRDIIFCECIVGLNTLVHNFIADAAELKNRAHEAREIYLKMICEMRLPLEVVSPASDINIWWTIYHLNVKGFRMKYLQARSSL